MMKTTVKNELKKEGKCKNTKNFVLFILHYLRLKHSTTLVFFKISSLHTLDLGMVGEENRGKR